MIRQAAANELVEAYAELAIIYVLLPAGAFGTSLVYDVVDIAEDVAAGHTLVTVNALVNADTES